MSVEGLWDMGPAEGAPSRSTEEEDVSPKDSRGCAVASERHRDGEAGRAALGDGGTAGWRRREVDNPLGLEWGPLTTEGSPPAQNKSVTGTLAPSLHLEILQRQIDTLQAHPPYTLPTFISHEVSIWLWWFQNKKKQLLAHYSSQKGRQIYQATPTTPLQLLSLPPRRVGAVFDIRAGGGSTDPSPGGEIRGGGHLNSGVV